MANELTILSTLAGAIVPRQKTLSPVYENRGGWFPLIRDWYAGAWQNNEIPVNLDSVLSFSPVFAAITLIASDISKLRIKLVEKTESDVWRETTNPAYSPVLRRPNPIQTRIQFVENWVLSKLMKGNTYALKFRDNRGVVTRLYILDPNRTQPMVSDDGSVFYQLQADNITGLNEPVMVPAREMIHDRFNCLFHPLVGVSPLFAAGLPATQGLNIQANSTRFFGNRSMPGGILTAPGAIAQDTAERLKAAWDTNYTGENFGKVAVLGDGLKFEPIIMSAEASQLIDQLRWTCESVASAFHVPLYKLGIGPAPTYTNIQSLNIEYYQQALQSHIESAELCLDDGLGIGEEFGIGTEFDIKGLMRMDSVTQIAVLRDAIGSGIMAPNEARAELDLLPVEGGESPYLQQQNFSLQALAKRDAQDDPFGKSQTTPPNNSTAPDVTRALPAPSAERDIRNVGADRQHLATRIRASAERFRRAA